jgi:hypothetical protein
MGPILNNILGNVLQDAAAAGLEATGKAAQRGRTVRRVLFVLALVCSAFIAGASALLWQSEHLPGVTGLWQAVQDGQPGWLLAAPGLAALAFGLLLVPLRGRMTLTTLVSAAIMGFTIGGLAHIQGGSGGVNAFAALSGIAAFVLPVATLALTLSDIPSLDSPMAHLSFSLMGRVAHLKALRRYGEQRGWQVRPPHGADLALRMVGPYDAGHDVMVLSELNITLSTGENMSLDMKVQLTSSRDIPAFRISYKKDVSGMFRGRGVARVSRPPRKAPLYAIILPPPGRALSDAFMDRFLQLAEAGRPFMKLLDFVQATPSGLQFVHNAMRLTVKDAQLDPVLAWLRELLGLMEEISPPKTGNAPGVQGARHL